MKKTGGISLISLIVTIVVIIVLAGIAIYNGIGKNIDETANTMDYNEIFELSEAVAQRALLNRLNKEAYALIGDGEDEPDKPFKVTMKIKSGDKEEEITKEFYPRDGWYKVTPDASRDLNLNEVRREYLVNYKTSEVVSTVPIHYEGVKYYTASSLKDALGGGSIIVSANRYDEKKGVNKPFIVSGMIPVKWSEGSWVVTNVDDNEWYDYAAADSNKGNLWANVMLMDEIEVSGLTNKEVRNSSLLELEGRTITKEGSMFVWIPRYSRGIIESQTKIVYSKLTEDYFKNSEVLEAFRENGVELTGIWVSKYDAGFVER